MLFTALASEVVDWVVLNAKTGVKSAKASARNACCYF